MSLLAKRYATALHLAAADKGAVDEVERQLAGLHAAVADASVRELLTSPDLATSERKAVIDKLTAGAHELVQSLVRVLVGRRRLEVLFDIYPAYRALVMAERGEVEGVVETPRPLSDDDLRRLGELAGQLSGNKVTLSSRVVPELIGGVRLRIGNILYDGSVQSSLAQLEQKLLQTSV